MTETTPTTVVEAAWEVVNKVGGIHTVVRTKARLLAEHYENYLLVGPLFPERRDIAFSEQPPPERLRHVFESLRQEGVHCVYGTWRIPGSPQTVLINARQATYNLDEIKGQLWEQYGIDTLHAAWDYNEPLQWAWAVGMFIERLQHVAQDRVVAHFHEWLAGMALLYLKIVDSRAASVFQTHATMLGRTISGSTEIKLYESLQSIDPETIAKQLGVMDKHSTERACAKECTVFTTVSEITAKEAERFFGRKPDVLLYNGIDTAEYPTVEEAHIQHIKSREEIKDFLDYYFFSHYLFDLDNTLIFFTSGRYEYRNKGLDVFIRALAKLNEHLKTVPGAPTVVAFFLVPGETHGIKTEILEERAAFSKLQEFVNLHSKDLIRKVLRSATDLSSLSCEDILSSETREQIAHLAKNLRHGGNPPLCTHNIPNEDGDPIIAGFRANGLDNAAEDHVKVIRLPIYLNGNDGLMDMPYEELVAGTHLGVFPSAYEPWGYTPLETAGLGVPAITTDLAGFGRYIVKHADTEGIVVLQREKHELRDVEEQLFEAFKEFCALDRFARHDRKLSAIRAAQHAGWETFIKRYYQAHRSAYEN